jgi:hypothetical protein
MWSACPVDSLSWVWLPVRADVPSVGLGRGCCSIFERLQARGADENISGGHTEVSLRVGGRFVSKGNTPKPPPNGTAHRAQARLCRANAPAAQHQDPLEPPTAPQTCGFQVVRAEMPLLNASFCPSAEKRMISVTVQVDYSVGIGRAGWTRCPASSARERRTTRTSVHL